VRPEPPFLLPDSPVESLDAWKALGGCTGLARAQQLGPAQTIKEIGLAGLRGRGGGGFPTGRKWSGVRAAGSPGDRKFVVANGAEGEPATFKDRAIMRANPYQIVEGLAVAAFVIGAEAAFIGVKGTFTREIDRLTAALVDMQQAGVAGDIPITIVPGPEEYLFGEEKAMLEVIEGNAPMPRLYPPYEHGLYANGRDSSNPTLVNNVETLANVPHILREGAEWYRSLGAEDSPGHAVATVVGDVVSPGVSELELGIPLRNAIDAIGGGVPTGRSVNAVFSGIANPVLTADKLDTPLTYEDMAAAGSGLGALGFAVYDDQTCIVELARAFSQFLYVESCNQCPACKFGSGEITAYLQRIERGGGSEFDIEVIGARLRTVTDGNRCYLPVQEQAVVSSLLRSFPEEFAAHLEGATCPRPGSVVVPLLVDINDGGAVYDEHRMFKRPDWTYPT